MSIEAMRDRLAELTGLRQAGIGDSGLAQWRFTDPQGLVTYYELDTLDGIAALWPEGWTWIRLRYIDQTGSWITIADNDRWSEIARIPDTGDELHDRMALTIKVLEAKP